VVPLYIIDDDRDVRRSLVMLSRTLDIPSRPFQGCADFLDELPFLDPGAIFVDLRMPEQSGHDLLVRLKERDCYWPAVMFTGHGEISAAVQAMKLGAIDFLEKPFTEEEFVAAVRECALRLPEAVQRSLSAKASRLALKTLTRREQEVFRGVVKGQTSKEVAAQLRISHRTVETYRMSMMAKLGAQRLHDLLKISADIWIDEP
jgi:two-component system, LuxR family, response regulator FixJ